MNVNKNENELEQKNKNSLVNHTRYTIQLLIMTSLLY